MPVSLTAWAAWFSSRSVVVTMTVTGRPRCWPNSPEAMPALRPSLTASCSRWRPAAGVGLSVVDLVLVGLVAAGADGGVDRLQIGAGLRVEPAGQSAHAVGTLRCQVQPAAAGAVVLVEQAVGVEVIGDPPPDHGDELGVLTSGVAHQDSFGLLALGIRNQRGQYIESVADRSDVVVADLAVLDGGGQVRQLRRQCGSGKGAARADAGGDADPAPHLTGCDAQPLPQQLAHHGACGQVGIVGSVERFDDLAEEPVHQPTVDPVLDLQPFSHLNPERVAHRCPRLTARSRA